MAHYKNFERLTQNIAGLWTDDELIKYFKNVSPSMERYYKFHSHGINGLLADPETRTYWLMEELEDDIENLPHKEWFNLLRKFSRRKSHLGLKILENMMLKRLDNSS